MEDDVLPAAGGTEAYDDAGWDLEQLPGRRALRPWRQSPAAGVVYAELPLRGVAFVIDFLVLEVLIRLVGRPVITQAAAIVQGESGAFQDPHLGILMGAASELVVVWVVSLAVAVYSWTVFRATPGQMVLGLFTLTAARGRTPRVRSAVVRWAFLFAPLVFVAPVGYSVFAVHEIAPAFGIDSTLAQVGFTAVAPVWYAALALSAANDRRGRGLHDRAAGTVVVRRALSPS